ncbi:MAG: cytochrome c [Rhodospirillales bacterium]|nr:cytochrome c [Rhodospirillales bacterium]
MRVSQTIRLLLVVAVAYAIVELGIPAIGALMKPGTWPVVPVHLVRLYLFFIVIVILLYAAADEERWSRVRGDFRFFFGAPGARIARTATIVAISLAGGYGAYDAVRPRFETPPELRAVHPAPPSSFSIGGKMYDLLTLDNPLRADKQNFAGDVKAGAAIFFKQCFFCHGDKLDGRGLYADAFHPPPANFRDIGTIAQLQESYLFWRIATGGPGLPREGGPWMSSMPVWHRFLSETEIWQVILFLYDFTGHAPRAREP